MTQFSRRSSPPASQDIRRMVCVALFLLLIYSSIVVQFFRIQIVEHEKWESKAYSQHTVVVNEPFKRGVFFSNGNLKQGHPLSDQPLVIDVPKFHLYVDPKGIPEAAREDVKKQLTLLLQLDEDAQARLAEDLLRDSRHRCVARWVNAGLKEQVESWWGAFAKKRKIARNALFYEKDYQRSYPFGKLLGQVLHTVRDRRDEETSQQIPTGGLELTFNEYLQGRPGKRLFYRSPRHSMDVGKVIVPPQNGADVYLTINHHLQAIAEEEIEKQVHMSDAKRGWALMMDPHTGEILALAQYPFFYPERYAEFFNDEELLKETQVKAVTDPYEPGSTMKAVTMAVGLLANEERKRQGKSPLFDPDEKMGTLPCTLPGRTKVLKDLRNHSFLNMDMALQKSSNIYMAKVIERVIKEMGPMWYRSVLQNIFGYGKKTGLEIGAESGGLLPLPGKLHPNGTLEWSAPTPYSLAMGHNILVNTVQMARSFAILANGGYDIQPTLVKRIVSTLPDGSTRVFLDNEVERERRGEKRLLEGAVQSRVVQGLRYVTKPGGAATKADIHGFTEAGKTSTSEKIIDGVYSKKDHISTFIGFAPVRDPKFVLIVVIDEPAYKFVPGLGKNQMGGSCAAPAFKRIGLRTLEYLGVAPDDPFGYPRGDPRREGALADWTEEAEKLNELYKVWN